MNLHLCAYFTLVITPIFISNTRQNVITSDEDQFFRMYGLNGRWEPLRKPRLDEAGYMMRLCDQAHEKSGLGPANSVRASGFDTRTLKHSKTHLVITVDIVKYGVCKPNTTEIDPRYWYLTKGLKNDCVFYLEPLDYLARELKIGNHVCGLNIL